MITFLQVLYPYFVLFYLTECFAHVKSFQVIFYSQFGKYFKVKRRGIRFIGVSPLNKVFVADRFPHFCSSVGVHLWNRDRIDDHDLFKQAYFNVYPYDQVGSVEIDGDRLRFSGSKTVRVGTVAAAQAIGGIIRECAKSPKKAVKAHRVRKDSNAVVELGHDRLFLLLGFLGMMLFGCMFIMLPVALYTNFPISLERVLWIMGIAYTSAMGLAAYGHRKLFQRKESTTVFVLSLIFSPVNAIHAIHLITKKRAFTGDWLTLASALMKPAQFRPILLQELRRIRLSKAQCVDPELKAYLDDIEDRYLPLLKTAGTDEQAIFRPPEKKDPAAFSYCPLCETEYMEGISTCTDCHIHLEPL